MIQKGTQDNFRCAGRGKKKKDTGLTSANRGKKMMSQEQANLLTRGCSAFAQRVGMTLHQNLALTVTGAGTAPLSSPFNLHGVSPAKDYIDRFASNCNHSLTFLRVSFLKVTSSWQGGTSGEAVCPMDLPYKGRIKNKSLYNQGKAGGKNRAGSSKKSL